VAASDPDESTEEREDREEKYNNIKFVIKELLFSGARRKARNNLYQTA